MPLLRQVTFHVYCTLNMLIVACKNAKCYTLKVDVLNLVAVYMDVDMLTLKSVFCVTC